jgi:GNAT superfamily N-acetyltransferase
MDTLIVEIDWRIERLDEGEKRDPRDEPCLLRISGKIKRDGQDAGQLEAYYVLDLDLASSGAFFGLWDMDSTTCSIYEELTKPSSHVFREPLPRLLECFPGMIVVDYIALFPDYRGAGLGREVMRQLVRCCADEAIGAVLLDSIPLQHRDGAYDFFDHEVRALPWNGDEQDTEQLRRHLRGWGMHHIANTRYMVARPEILSENHSAEWPPVPILCHWNTCVYCQRWIDLDAGGWETSPDGPIHSGCR